MSSQQPEPNSRRYARLMRIAIEGDRAWDNDELREMFEQEMAAPVPFDLSRLGRSGARAVASQAGARGLLLRSFGDLLQHPRPQPEMLRMVKDFAKRCLQHPDPPMVRDIASSLYLLAVLAARLRCGQRISRLSDADLRNGAAEMQHVGWLPPWAIQLLREALAGLEEQSDERKA